MKRYIKSYDTGLTGFESTVKEVLTNPKDKNHLRCSALSDILENALADARYELGLEYDIDDSRYVVDGDANIKSAYTFICALYQFRKEKDKPVFDALSAHDKMRVRQHLLKVLELPEGTRGVDSYFIDINFFYSSNRQRPCIEIVIQRTTL